ncbi:trehalose operon repressor [Clostridium taeniosporum]|uniref:Trehalose operon repressor n=1 Tax=Clostridium taeniosporum TaxID=394958 RepID=A0A1D7XJU2_9CLOT|nr:trehalose operon repressor [Clostridium taeniosporum]AOR23624.1 trehalose operon repressor [Clostridium taeniosporum]
MGSKYFNIYSEIANRIENGIYKANDEISSESDLMKEYSVSRDTARKALKLLEENGYIQKIKGRRSFVLDINKFDFPVSGVVSFKEIADKLGPNSKTKVEVLECIEPNENIMKKLELKSEDKVWKIIRSRSIKNEKIILDKDYLVQEFVENITEEICEESIYKYIEDELGLKIAYAKKEITVQFATEEDKKYLNMKNFNMIVVVKSYTYLDDTSLFQYTESRHRPDKFKFVDFARRRK